MKTVRKFGRYELQADSYSHCQILDTSTGNVSARMDKIMLASFSQDSDSEMIRFSDAVFSQEYHTCVSDAEMEVFNNQP